MHFENHCLKWCWSPTKIIYIHHVLTVKCSDFSLHSLFLFLGGLPCSCCMSILLSAVGVYKLFQWRSASPHHSFHHSSIHLFNFPAHRTHLLPLGFLSFILEVIFVTLSFSSSSFCCLSWDAPVQTEASLVLWVILLVCYLLSAVVVSIHLY